MKNIVKPLIWTVVIIAGVAIGKDLIIKSGIEAGVPALIGVKLKMRMLHLNIFNGLIHIRKLHVSNPKGFDEKTMIDMPEILIEANIPAIIKGKTHLRDMRIHLKQFDVIKNKDGEVNLNAFTALAAGEKKPGEPKESKKEKAPLDLQIDHLTIRIDSVAYIDHTAGPEPSRKEFTLNLDEEFNNITNPNALVSIILFKVLKNTTIGQLTNIDMTALSEASAKAIESGKKIAADTQAKAKEALDSVSEKVDIEAMKGKASEMTDKTSASVKDAAGDVKDMAGGLWGSVKAKVAKQ